MTNAETWDKVRLFMDKHCGVSLAPDQIYLMDARLLPVAKAHGFIDVGQLVDKVSQSQAQAPAAQAMIDAMTTHETYFFRDTAFWQSFEKLVMPRMVSQNRRSLRIWSAACSHGQELYTVQMIVAESFPQFVGRTTIVATDVSDAALARAKEGIYSPLEVNRGLIAPRLIKHFEKAPGGFRAKPHLKEGIIFRQHNLLDSVVAGGPFDIVMCRNVFIYFTARDRQVAVGHLLSATAPDGFIGMGTSEVYLQPAVVPGWFDRKSKEN